VLPARRKLLLELDSDAVPASEDSSVTPSPGGSEATVDQATTPVAAAPESDSIAAQPVSESASLSVESLAESVQVRLSLDSSVSPQDRPQQQESEDSDAEDESALYFSAHEVRQRLCEEASPETLARRSAASTDPSGAVLREPWEKKRERIRLGSPYGTLASWELHSCIVKTGDNLRQEWLASQIIQQMLRIFSSERLSLWLRPTRILACSMIGGLMETITDAVSLHSLHKQNAGMDLRAFFLHEYGDPSDDRFLTAQRSFVESLAGYSLACYVMQLKDRHNGNILLDAEGHIIHIDYGFLFGQAPRSSVERAPFKLTPEFIDLMGGMQSDMGRYFSVLLVQVGVCVCVRVCVCVCV
jgi:phosphatidylinositol 4-kinase B